MDYFNPFAVFSLIILALIAFLIIGCVESCIRKCISKREQKRLFTEKISVYSMKLSRENIPTPQFCSRVVDIENTKLALNLKRPNERIQQIFVDSTCSICLLEFKARDVISFSSNKDCQHVFHQDCILRWLYLKNKCPCCHRTFLCGDQLKTAIDEQDIY